MEKTTKIKKQHKDWKPTNGEETKEDKKEHTPFPKAEEGPSEDSELNWTNLLL